MQIQAQAVPLVLIQDLQDLPLVGSNDGDAGGIRDLGAQGLREGDHVAHRVEHHHGVRVGAVVQRHYERHHGNAAFPVGHHAGTAAEPLLHQRQDALVLYHNGKYKESIAVCEEELLESPNRIESYVVMCWSLVKNKQYAEAEQRATEGLAVSAYDLRLIEILGEARYYLGKNNGAMEQFQKYVANANDSSSRLGTAYYFMGEIYIRQARYQHADISLSSAVKKEPLYENWWIRLGYAREMAGNYLEALEAYDEALRLNSSSVDASRGRERVKDKIK